MRSKMILSLLLLSFSLSISAQFETAIVEKKIEDIWSENKSERITKLKELLIELPPELRTAYSSEKDYWQAYIHYKLGLSYLSEDKDKAKESFHNAIEILEQIERPNSESYALGGTLSSTLISVSSDKAFGLSQDANKQFQKSLELSKNNPRAYLGLGKSDFYKPAQYGGGERVEEYLKKALSYYTEEEKSNEQGPTWGKEEVYYLLSAFYNRIERIRDAKFHNSLGLKEFPQNELLLIQKEKFN